MTGSILTGISARSWCYQGDTGVVRESWSFLGEIYYTVEFFARAAVVIMRGQEMARAARRGHVRPLR